MMKKDNAIMKKKCEDKFHNNNIDNVRKRKKNYLEITPVYDNESGN